MQRGSACADRHVPPNFDPPHASACLLCAAVPEPCQVVTSPPPGATTPVPHDPYRHRRLPHFLLMLHVPVVFFVVPTKAASCTKKPCSGRDAATRHFGSMRAWRAPGAGSMAARGFRTQYTMAPIGDGALCPLRRREERRSVGSSNAGEIALAFPVPVPVSWHHFLRPQSLAGLAGL